MITKTLRKFTVAQTKKPERYQFKRSVEMKGLTLADLPEMLSDKESFIKTDRNFSSYKIDIVLRVIHDHFKITKDENKLPSQILKNVFDAISDLLLLCKWKSSQVSHLAFLAFACKYDNTSLME